MTDIQENDLDAVIDEHGSAVDQEDAERAFAEAAGEKYEPPISEMESAEEPAEPQAKPHESKKPEAEPETFTYTKADLDRIRQEAALEAEQKHKKRIRDLSGEVGGLRGKLENLETARAAADASGDSPTSQQIRDAATDSAKMDALREEFPEVADALEEAIKGVKPQNMDEINARLKAAEELRERADSTAVELHNLREIRKMDKSLPGWEEMATSQECKDWLKTQSQEIQQAFQRAFYEEANASDAVILLNKFQSETTPPDTPDLTASSRQHQDRLEKATVPTSGKATTQRQPLTAEEAFEEAARRTMGM